MLYYPYSRVSGTMYVAATINCIALEKESLYNEARLTESEGTPVTVE
jgi:hypothetical protein